jgi:hypothetical protein
MFGFNKVGKNRFDEVMIDERVDETNFFQTQRART